MSRKRADRSNAPQIGIFLDKKSANYNNLILEALLSQEATAWQLAEILHKKIDPRLDTEIKEVKRYHAQKIYSVIQRKQGRLEDLQNKGYLKEENGIWALTKKGFIALAIQKPDLVNNEIQKGKDVLSELFQKAMPNDMRKVAMGVYVDFSEIKPHFDKIDKLPLFQMFIEEARALLSQGIELDRISENDFQTMVLSRASLTKKVREHGARF
jgi:hypothetical protein